MRYVENSRKPSRRRKVAKPVAEKKAEKKLAFEQVAEPMKIVLFESVKIRSKNGEEFVLEAGDTLRVSPKRK